MKKRILSLLLSVLMLVTMLPLSTAPILAAGNGYTDVPSSYWANGVISKWSSGDISVLAGDGNGMFFPAKGLSLGEFATILSKIFCYTMRTAVMVTPAWADEYVEKAVAAGIIEKAATIDASVMVTREQAIKYIALAYNIAPIQGETSFADNADIGPEYKPYITAFQKLGYIVGKPGNIFDPQATYTRAEAMQVIDNTTSAIVDTFVDGQAYAKSVVMRKPGAILKNTIVDGNLIIAQGVGDGEVTLDNVTVKGKLVVSGGGNNSIIITGGSQISYTVINKQGGEPANIRVEGGSSVTAIEVNAGSGAKITGNIAKVSVSANATLEIAKDSIVESVIVEGDKVTILVSSGGTAQMITIEGDKVVVQGQGRVEAVVVEKGSGVEIVTTGTKVTNNGTETVKTANGQVTVGSSSTTKEPVKSTDNSTSDNNYTLPTTATANTLDALRNYLQSSSITTINVPVVLQNNDTDITIPAGKTVIFSQNAGLKVRNLTVNGTIRGNSGVVLNVRDTLSGTGLNAGNQNGFFGTNSTYTTHFWMWFTANDAVATTGWWPTSVWVDTEAKLAEALSVSTISEVHITGNCTITQDFSINNLYANADIIIDAGVAINANIVVIFNSLTVNGTLSGTGDNARIYMYGDSTLALSGTEYVGPSITYFEQPKIARMIPWESGSWGTPYLYNTDTGSDSVFTKITELSEIAELAETYPELAGIHINGGMTEANDFVFDSNFDFDVAVPILIHGNQTFGFGVNAYTFRPVIVDAGVTLTVKDGATIYLVSDDDTLNALVGTDDTSIIVVENGGSVYKNESTTIWDSGTYKWNSETESWDLQE